MLSTSSYSSDALNPLLLLLFLLSLAIDLLLGAHAWPAVLAGNLFDPDSYMRLLRIEQGIHAGHLLTTVARDGSGAGVMVEWSRLLDILLWVMAAPLAACLGWHRALFAAGAALGPLSIGALGASLAWVAAPFAADKFLWSAAVAAAVLPAILVFAAPGVVHYHILLLVLIALTVGFCARAWHNAPGAGFCAGLAGGCAIWLTPETMPFVLMAFAALLLRWLTTRMGAALTCCAAGFFDILGIALTLDPPEGGYGMPEIDRLSLVYVILAIFLLAGSATLWRLERRAQKFYRPAGLALMAGLLIAWIAMFPAVAQGPYGVMSAADMQKFFGVMQELQPLHGAQNIIFLWPGLMAFFYALWRAAQSKPPEQTFLAPPQARWIWLYLAACTLVTLILGIKFILFVSFSACIAAALLPIALSTATARYATQKNAASWARILIFALVLGTPEATAIALTMAAPKPPPTAQKFPSCSLRDIAPLLAPAAGKIVLADIQATPEILYRSQVETVGSLYQHGVPAYLRARAAWRAAPGATIPDAVKQTGARYILFCPQPGRYAPVADVPHKTLWDALADPTPPAWLTLQGQDAAGWRLYEVK